MARHEHRGSSQHPGLRADGPAGLRAYLHAAFLGFQARAGPFGAKKTIRALSAGSIELRAALRYTGTQLRAGDRAFRYATSAYGVFLRFISNYQRLSDVFNIRSGRHDYRRNLRHPARHDHA